jgi:hypothetical protein
MSENPNPADSGTPTPPTHGQTDGYAPGIDGSDIQTQNQGTLPTVDLIALDEDDDDDGEGEGEEVPGTSKRKKRCTSIVLHQENRDSGGGWQEI